MKLMIVFIQIIVASLILNFECHKIIQGKFKLLQKKNFLNKKEIKTVNYIKRIFCSVKCLKSNCKTVTINKDDCKMQSICETDGFIMPEVNNFVLEKIGK